MQSVLFACCFSLLPVRLSHAVLARSCYRIQKPAPVLQTSRRVAGAAHVNALVTSRTVARAAAAGSPVAAYTVQTLDSYLSAHAGVTGIGDVNSRGQSVSTEVVGREGDGMFTDAEGRRVVAPEGMAYRDIYHAFLWTGSKKHDLGTLPDGKESDAKCVNEKGQVVGSASGIPVLWQSGKILPLPNNGEGEALWISDNGDIAGRAPSACFWHNGKLHLINGLAGLSSGAECINDKGEVVGSYCKPAGPIHAFYYRNGKTSDLPLLRGCTESHAYGINNQGDIVGQAVEWKPVVSKRTGLTAAYPLYHHSIYHAILWHKGACIDLNTLIPAASHWRLTEARHIHQSGWITGDGYLDGKENEFLLIPRSNPSKPNTKTPGKHVIPGSAVTVRR